MGWLPRTLVVVSLAGGTLLAGAPAHADDGGFLAALDARGVYRSGTPDARLAAGRKFCAELRGGSTPDEIVGRYQANLRTFGAPSTVDDLRVSLRPMIDIAQHELCPDTLG